jgi:flavin prenyltransferase
MSNTIVVAISGASGAVYSRRLIEVLLELGSEVHVCVSTSGADVWQHELGDSIWADGVEPRSIAPNANDEMLSRLHCHRNDDYFAPIASGAFLTDGMVVCPCSGHTLAAVSHSLSGNLIQRAAEVHLKEGRKLVLVTRETPLSVGQLENMSLAARHGAIILPASPGWYHGVESTDDLVDFIVARVLDQLGVANDLIKRWGDVSPSDS